jgi:hypothetical protein
MLSPSLFQVIDEHTDAVRSGRVRCEHEICPRCSEAPDGFKIHERRKRTFGVVIERLVHRVSSLIVRWKCGLCKQTFSQCPAFALPYKRYVRDVVLALGRRYLDDDSTSYRKAVQVEGLPVFYDNEPDGALDERVLAGSTLHRWLGFLGRLEHTLRSALRLIRSASPTCDLFRTAQPVVPWKYRSSERRRRLQIGIGLTACEGAFQALFETSIFPSLATHKRWT